MLGCLTSETMTTFMDITTDCNNRFVLGKEVYHSRNEVGLIETQSRNVNITTTAE
jgi:hypothetical protein